MRGLAEGRGCGSKGKDMFSSCLNHIAILGECCFPCVLQILKKQLEIAKSNGKEKIIHFKRFVL